MAEPVPGDIDTYTITISPKDDPNNTIEEKVIPSDELGPTVFTDGLLPNKTYIVTGTATIGNHTSEPEVIEVTTDELPLVKLSNVTTTPSSVNGEIEGIDTPINNYVIEVTDTDSGELVDEVNLV